MRLADHAAPVTRHNRYGAAGRAYQVTRKIVIYSEYPHEWIYIYCSLRSEFHTFDKYETRCLYNDPRAAMAGRQLIGQPNVPVRTGGVVVAAAHSLTNCHGKRYGTLRSRLVC
jgi:hypothetical protein